MTSFYSTYSNHIRVALKWILLSLLTGALAGSGSAVFLIALEWATETRENNVWIIWLLPIAGLLIGLSYHYLGKQSEKGNNLVIDSYFSPEREKIPLRMAPLVVISTVLTHLFGGSAGREGTAVQMGAAFADQLRKWFHLDENDRKILLLMGISAGFASVFGTPLAGTVFALEVMIIGRMRYKSLIPALLVALIANYVCDLWPVHHTHYEIPEVPGMNIPALFWGLFAGLLFGLAARLFSQATHFWGRVFSQKIAYPPLRPVIGGIIIALAVWMMGTTRYIGLGIPVILESFEEQVAGYDFLLKILFTSFTLGAGFKGGEVTPLFFTGAVLGSALSFFIPLPVALLAGMGFVAVFSGATNTPIACTLMGIELFGVESGLFIAVACFTAYLFSGHTGIYNAQLIGTPKWFSIKAHKGMRLRELHQNEHKIS